MFKHFVIAAMALTGCGSASADTLKELLDKARVNWNAPTEPFKVIGNIHYVGTNGLAVYLITSPQGHVLVDTAMPETAGLIRANIEKLGFKVGDIKYILNTHAHIDHTGGFADIKRASGAKLIAGAKDKPLLEGGYYPGRQKDTELNFPPVKVDRTVGEGDTISVGDIKLVAHATPGHSPGCTSYEMSVRDGDITRSVLFFCSATVALNRLVGAPTHPTIVNDYRKTFAWAKSAKFDVLLAPHPEMYGMQAKRAKLAPGAPNPFVNPGEFNTYLASLEKSFEEGLAKQTAALKK